MNQNCPTLVISGLPEVPRDDSLGCRPVNLYDRLSVAHLDLRRASLIDPRSNLVTLVRGTVEEESSENDTDDPQMKPTKITAAIPYMSRPLALICLLLNIIVPGTAS
ncbi:uncharacterized protein LOC144596974 [Rhinoraja longicauda]